MKTYKEIADKFKLDEVTKNRYVKYMKLHWSKEEKQQCSDGYADEWAMRFKTKTEYGCSDVEGLCILEVIDKNIEEIEA